MKIFLGGTVGKSTWRDELIPLLETAKIAYFNPVVENRIPEYQEEEKRQKNDECDVHLYVITSEMSGVLSIAEAVYSAHQKDKSCILQIVPDGFDLSQLKSLYAVADMVSELGGIVETENIGFSWILEMLNGKSAVLVDEEEEYPYAKKIVCKTCKFKKVANKTLDNLNSLEATQKVTDIKIFGDGDLFKLLSKASSETEGWMKSTKAMEIPHVGCLVQVTTQQTNPDGSYSIAEALTFVPGVFLIENAAGRCLIKAP